jgi:hypothetical protein
VTVLVAKLLLAPGFVVAVSLAGRRWGVGVAGVLGGLPVVVAPILAVVTIVHGRDFGAEAAAGALLALAALALFVVVYANASQRLGPLPSLLAGGAAFLAGVGLLHTLDLGPAPSLAFVGIAFAAGLRCLPAAPAEPVRPAPPPWWDLPARGLAAAALVIAITAVSGSLGPSLTGLLAPFPILTSVLAVFTHGHAGPRQVTLLMRSFLVGFYSFATFCFVLAITVDSLGGVAAFSLALLAALGVQVLVFAMAWRWLGLRPADCSAAAS